MRQADLYCARVLCEPDLTHRHAGHAGVQLHGALMTLLKHHSPSLVRKLHERPEPRADAVGDQPKPRPTGRRSFCLGPLSWPDGSYLCTGDHCASGNPLAFTLSAADADLTAALTRHLHAEARFSLGHEGHEVAWRVVAVEPADPTATLARLFAHAQAQRRMVLHLLSPTMFKTNSGGFTALPDPAKIFAGLAEHTGQLYKGVEPAIAPEEITQLVRWHVAVEELQLQTRRYGEGPGTVGAVGGMVLKASKALSVEQLRHLNLLLSLARYVGVGAKTSRGYGQAVDECR